MSTPPKTKLFNKVLVPVVYGCEQASVLSAARAIAGKGDIVLIGLVYIPEGESLSSGASQVRELRQTLRRLAGTSHNVRWAEVFAAYRPWDEIIRITERHDPDLLILEYTCQLEALKVTPTQVLTHPPCDIAIVNSKIADGFNNALIPIRGGPYAELALRTALSMRHAHPTQVTTLHVVSQSRAQEQDAAFRGIELVLKNLPEVKKQQIVTDNPAETIFEASKQYDLIVMGASSRPAEEFTSIGPVAERIMHESQCGVIVVKTKRPLLTDPESEEAGQTAISVLVDKWFAENTFHADEFEDLLYLYHLKRERGLTISLALPALNEEATVGNVIATIQQALMLDVPLLDEIVLIDSDSTDRTREIAQSLDVPVYIHQAVLPKHGSRRGKGEALWKSLYCTRGDIVIWLDTDIVNIHPRFAYGLIGPLLLRPDIQFVKGFYRRPLKVGDKIQAGGGGRVTELTARPLLNLFYPELSGVIQPLSGEYGGRRSALEQIRFFSGYGVEIGLLIDVLDRSGLSAIAQVDLQERIHHNQPLEALSKMSFAIIQAVMRKLESRYGQSILENVNRTMKLIHYEQDSFRLDIEEIAERDRPPMVEIPEYREQLRILSQS
ncbi:MAG TPA: glucosyl-3-phosphoglycerate synthase [Anaerolineales bacterium]|nr:glucosyl-3-phosphoglycerate synthase [Anaerolineales bacterium]